MTPRMSVRARAREIYGEMAPSSLGFDGQGEAVPSTPLPNPPPQGGREQAEQAASGGGEKEAAPDAIPAESSGGKSDLTARIRDLYEKSAVPVREIARIAGVTERTLYRYVEKRDWKRRYQVLPRGEAAAAANRGRRWQVAPERAADVAPAKGSGGRFIRREDIGKPYPTGLKALDPASRSRALAASGQADRLSRAAQAEAAEEAQHERVLRAFALVNRVGNGLAAYQQEIRKKPAAARSADPLMRLHQLTLSRAIDELEAEMAESARIRLQRSRLCPSGKPEA